MGFVRSALNRAAALTESGTPNWFSGDDAPAGVHVSEETALHYGPFFAGVRVIAEDVGSLPLITYERLERGKKRAYDHRLYGLLHDAPNDLMTAVTFRSTIQAHALTWKAGYAYIVRARDGSVEELWPLRPDRITPKATPKKGDKSGRVEVWYHYKDQRNGIDARLAPEEVLVIGGLGFDGISGYSLVEHAKQSIGLGIATEQYGSAVFRNGSRPGGVLRHPGTLTDDAQKRVRTNWENIHRGLDRAQRIAILEEGMEYESVGIPPEDAQFLETRRFSVTEMARWLRLPPHKIGDLDRATFSNIEWQGIDYVTSALRIWLVRWEQAIRQKLITEDERKKYFSEHLVDGLLRGDQKTRYDAYAIGRNWGWLSADDVLEIENRNPLPDGRGSVYLIPLNMVPAPTPEEIEAKATAAAAKPAEEPVVEPVDESAAGDQSEDAPRAAQLARQLGMRGLDARKNIAESYEQLIAEADLRIAKLERAEVTKLVKRYLEPRAVQSGRTIEEFFAAVSKLYGGLITDRSMKAMLPLLTQLALDIATSTADDIAFDGDVDLKVWAHSYTRSHIDYRLGSSQSQLRKDIGLSTDDPAFGVGLILQRLDNWVAERPERTAKWETNQMPNAAARETYRKAGIKRLTWQIVGDTCPFCRKLDGKVVGIADPFIAAGGKVTGLEQVLNIDRNTFHPPLHPGCDCQVVPA